MMPVKTVEAFHSIAVVQAVAVIIL